MKEKPRKLKTVVTEEAASRIYPHDRWYRDMYAPLIQEGTDIHGNKVRKAHFK
jgi:hypothetical protein